MLRVCPKWRQAFERSSFLAPHPMEQIGHVTSKDPVHLQPLDEVLLGFFEEDLDAKA